MKVNPHKLIKFLVYGVTFVVGALFVSTIVNKNSPDSVVTSLPDVLETKIVSAEAGDADDADSDAGDGGGGEDGGPGGGEGGGEGGSSGNSDGNEGL